MPYGYFFIEVCHSCVVFMRTDFDYPLLWVIRVPLHCLLLSLIVFCPTGILLLLLIPFHRDAGYVNDQNDIRFQLQCGAYCSTAGSPQWHAHYVLLRTGTEPTTAGFAAHRVIKVSVKLWINKNSSLRKKDNASSVLALLLTAAPDFIAF